MSDQEKKAPTAPDLAPRAQPEPQCPKCAVTGSDYIISKKGGTSSAKGKQFVLAPFNIIFCSVCGHVYGVTGVSS